MGASRAGEAVALGEAAGALPEPAVLGRTDGGATEQVDAAPPAEEGNARGSGTEVDVQSPMPRASSENQIAAGEPGGAAPPSSGLRNVQSAPDFIAKGNAPPKSPRKISPTKIYAQGPMSTHSPSKQEFTPTKAYNPMPSQASARSGGMMMFSQGSMASSIARSVEYVRDVAAAFGELELQEEDPDMPQLPPMPSTTSSVHTPTKMIRGAIGVARNMTSAMSEAEVDVEDPDMPRTPLTSENKSSQHSPVKEGFDIEAVIEEVPEKQEPSWLVTYFRKYRGAGVPTRPRVAREWHAFTFFGAFVGIATLGGIDFALRTYVNSSWAVLAPPFGAMAVLLFSEPYAPLVQPYNVVVGNSTGAWVGLIVCELLELMGAPTQGELKWLAAALAVCSTIFCQERLGAVHPPGGATALVYVIEPRLRAMGIFYPFVACLLGSVCMVVVGMVTNNLSSARCYPQRTWPFLRDRDVKVHEGTFLQTYFAKFAGAGVKPFPRLPLSQSPFSFVGAFIGISTLGLLPGALGLPEPLLIGSFGAMSVLLFSATKAPLAQPRNAIMGNAVGAIIGVAVFKLFGLFGHGSTLELFWLRAALAVSLTIVSQEATRSVHPPGGATAMIFLTLDELHDIAFLNVLSPALLGTVILVCIAVVTNNVSAARTYPQGWW